NLFRFCRNNPVNRVDTDGRAPVDYTAYKLNRSQRDMVDKLAGIGADKFWETDASRWEDIPGTLKDAVFDAIGKTLRDNDLSKDGLPQVVYDNAKGLFHSRLEWKGYTNPSSDQSMGLLHLYSAMEGARYINHHARVHTGHSSGPYHHSLDQVVNTSASQLAKSGGEYTVGYSHDKKTKVESAKKYLNKLRDNSKFITRAFNSALERYQNEDSAKEALRDFKDKTMYRGTRMRANSITTLENAARSDRSWTAKQFLSVSPDEKQTRGFALGTFGTQDEQHKKWRGETSQINLTFSSAGAMPTVMTSEIEFIFPAGTKFNVKKTTSGYHLSRQY
ncbi:hypothetical protein, partial [Enterobacter sp. 22466]|uniref:hypothetical protein n=1 Tax=Enterobacter sp. 22466 TaxID=3453924 RepID=UPI003F8550D9